MQVCISSPAYFVAAAGGGSFTISLVSTGWSAFTFSTGASINNSLPSGGATAGNLIVAVIHNYDTIVLGGSSTISDNIGA